MGRQEGRLMGGKKVTSENQKRYMRAKQNKPQMTRLPEPASTDQEVGSTMDNPRNPGTVALPAGLPFKKNSRCLPRRCTARCTHVDKGTVSSANTGISCASAKTSSARTPPEKHALRPAEAASLRVSQTQPGWCSFAEALCCPLSPKGPKASITQQLAE